MSAACSPGGETIVSEVSERTEGREILQEVQTLLRSDRVEEARSVLQGLSDPVLLSDSRVRRVREMLEGGLSDRSRQEAADLLERTIEDIR